MEQDSKQTTTQPTSDDDTTFATDMLNDIYNS